MALKTTKWDSAEYLKTEEDIAEYLNAAVEEAGDDTAFIAHALGIVARAKNVSKLARDTAMSRQGIYEALSSEGNPSFDTVMKLGRAMGLTIEWKPSANKTTSGKHRRRAAA
jgi:probable addiction module antidote protein